MKKLFLFIIGIALMMPCAAQNEGYVTMPDGSVRTFEQLMLSAEDMKTYLYSLTGAEKETVINDILTGLSMYIEQMNAMRGAALYGNAIFFDGVDFNEQTREFFFNCTFNEEMTGQRYNLEDFCRDNNMDQNMSYLNEQFKQSLPPGYISAYEWLKIKIVYVIKGSLTNVVMRYTIPLY